MFAPARLHRQLTALTSSTVVVAALVAFLGSPDSGTPASGQPPAAAVQLSPSGKIIDRLPGSAPTTVDFTDWLGHQDRAAPASPDQQAGFPVPLVNEFAFATTRAADHRPQPAKAKAPAKSAQRLPRPTTRPQGPTVAVAALPPPRPSSLQETQNVAEVVTAKERHLSVAGRMIAFVGSLASLGRVL